MEGCKQMGHIWNLSNYKEALIQPLKVNSPETKNTQPHVVHKNALEWSTCGGEATNTFMDCSDAISKVKTT